MFYAHSGHKNPVFGGNQCDSVTEELTVSLLVFSVNPDLASSNSQCVGRAP